MISLSGPNKDFFNAGRDGMSFVCYGDQSPTFTINKGAEGSDCLICSPNPTFAAMQC